uniref:Uncharacterized protein n=2 Tax=Choreotrichia TaxID=141411 RepID=A0A7S3I434_9SPIT|mmetsp:Transcript_33776/g.41743  ORF Transcript_33776/g.41743 Transcript_33776/m.41743 type:complete len:100 (+) Transcript_33776:2858-3157(+)
MDGVLERIDEDEEQKTEQSGYTDPDDADAAPEMLSPEKPEQEDETKAAPEFNAEDNIVEGAFQPGETFAPENDGQEHCTPTIDARVEEGFRSTDRNSHL